MTSWIIYWAPDLFMCCSLLILLVYGIIVNSKLQKQEIISFSSLSIEKKEEYTQKPSAVMDNPVQSQLHMNSLFIIWCLSAAYLSLYTPFSVVHWSGLFQIDFFSSHLSFILFMYASFCFMLIRGWQIQAKLVHEETLWLCCLALLGQRLLLCCTDLMSMYVCLELQSFCFIVICSLNYGSLYSVEAGRKLFLRAVRHS